jgi:PAS domain S-box-containing protein
MDLSGTPYPSHVDALPLTSAEQRLRDIIEYSTTGIALVSPNGRWLEANAALCSMVGYSLDELRFHFTSEITHPDDVLRDTEIRKELIERNVNKAQIEKRYIKKDGSIIWVSLSINLVLSESSEPEYFVCHIQDITEWKKSDEEREALNQRLVLATQAGQVGIWEWDFSTGKSIWDARMFALFGITRSAGDALTLQEWRNTVHPDDYASQRLTYERAMQGLAPYDTEYRAIWPNGEIHNIRSMGTIVRDPAGVPLRMVGINWDVTESHRLADQLMAEKERLLETVEKWTEAQQVAEKASKAKSEFLTIMSHELRTPLNAILGFGQLLEGQLFGPLGPKQKEYVEAILNSGEHLLELINDILELSKIESGEMAVEAEQVDVAHILKSVIATLTPSAARRTIELIGGDCPGDLPSVLADHVRVAQALINLGSNAIKYNRPGGTVTFTCEKIDGVWIRLAVTDTGIGIPENRQSELFQPFSRLGVEKKAIDGTGVGLALTKRLLKLMGGRIDFTSELDKGSCFWIDLPIYVAPKTIAAARSVNPPEPVPTSRADN